jgi:Ca-activated chloride channel family protein
MHIRFVGAALLGLVATTVGIAAYRPLPSVSPQSPAQPVFSTVAELVVLHVVVKDRTGAYVSGLSAVDFTVLEDGQRQTIQFFGKQDAPVTVGLLIDNSGSMRTMRDRVIAAAGRFVETSNQADEIFALVFNEVVRSALPPTAPFTNSAEVLRSALTAAISARGRTALYDAILAGLAYLEKGSHQRQVLLVVSDGGDNASTATFEQVMKKIHVSNTVIHTVGLMDPLEPGVNPKRLKQLADVTGGEAFIPRDTQQVEAAMHDIALDIRSAYTIGYVPTNPARDGRFRRIRVMVRAPAGRDLRVRTRRGYVVEKNELYEPADGDWSRRLRRFDHRN